MTYDDELTRTGSTVGSNVFDTDAPQYDGAQEAGIEPMQQQAVEKKDNATMPLPLRAAGELFGTLFVCFALYLITSLGSSIYGLNMAFIALATALVYGAVTMLFAKVSGAHLNPAITIASLLVGGTKIVDAIVYIVAQLVGAIAAGALMVWMLPVNEQITAKQWLTTAVNGFDKGSVAYSTLSQYGITFGVTLAVAVELLASLIIVGTAIRTQGKRNQALGMALAYGVGAAIAFPVTNAGLNPVRATGIAIFAQNKDLTQQPLQQLWVFWLAPILAAALVALAVIVAQMAMTPKQAPLPAQAALGTEAEAEGESEPETVTLTIPGSGDEGDGQVGAEQSQPQGYADEGVERH